jgi:hypothetical protein
VRKSLGYTKPKGEMKVKVTSWWLRCDPNLLIWRNTVRSRLHCNVAAKERTCWDPKDGELCLSRMKPEETLVEVRSDSDVQIDRQTWV